MKQIKINSYNLAIVVVGEALHITVTILTAHEISIRNFEADKNLKLASYNQFTEQFSKLPEDWNARKLECHNDKIILILK